MKISSLDIGDFNDNVTEMNHSESIHALKTKQKTTMQLIRTVLEPKSEITYPVNIDLPPPPTWGVSNVFSGKLKTKLWEEIDYKSIKTVFVSLFCEETTDNMTSVCFIKIMIYRILQSYMGVSQPETFNQESEHPSLRL